MGPGIRRDDVNVLLSSANKTERECARRLHAHRFKQQVRRQMRAHILQPVAAFWRWVPLTVAATMAWPQLGGDRVALASIAA